MAHAQHITPEERAQSVLEMFQHSGKYGFVTNLSRTLRVSRQTLYTWQSQGIKGLYQAFASPSPSSVATSERDRAILTLLLEGHNSIRDIQRCLVGIGCGRVSLGTIQAVIAEAQQRALDWFATQMPTTPRRVALDEIFGHQRNVAYLNIVDAQSGAVWGCSGPLSVDHESWLLLLWEAQDAGLQIEQTISDGGGAIGKACDLLEPHAPHGHDVWHLLHRWGQTQARLVRHHTTLDARTATVQRQADRCAAGGKPLGRGATADVRQHARQVEHAANQVAAIRYLGNTLQELLSVVILGSSGLRGLADRQADLDALLTLLAEVRDAATEGAIQTELTALYTATTRVRERLLVFAEELEPIQGKSIATLGSSAVQDIAWAWQRRKVLQWKTSDILSAIPAAWHDVAQELLETWDNVVRASSLVEMWHSLLRPHLAVHRRLSPGMLSLLAVYHNHRVYERGEHAGFNPLQLSGITDAPTDWWTALGYGAEAEQPRPKREQTAHMPRTTTVPAA